MRRTRSAASRDRLTTSCERSRRLATPVFGGRQNLFIRRAFRSRNSKRFSGRPLAPRLRATAPRRSRSRRISQERAHDMVRHKRPWTFVPAVLFLSTGAVTAAGTILYSGTGEPAAQEISAIGVSVMPGAVAKRAMMPPKPTATRTRTAGKNRLQVSTANGPNDDDSTWVELLDIDGDGGDEEAHLVWDDEDKVLYAFATGNFTCRNGDAAMADLLVAAYGANNWRNRPAGSGFWVADLDQGKCGAKTASLWGCKFDGAGSPTACGMVSIDARNDDLIILTPTN